MPSVHFLFRFSSFPAQDAIRRPFAFLFVSIVPQTAAFVKW